MLDLDFTQKSIIEQLKKYNIYNYETRRSYKTINQRGII
jgi:hypothetical protein